MKREFFIFFAVCALALAFVPREKRANDNVKTDSIYCAEATPCAWSVYDSHTRRIQEIVTNTYCLCKPPTTCQNSGDEIVSSAFVHRCKMTSIDTAGEN